MTPRRRCPCCGGPGTHFLDANIDVDRVTNATFASRKRPELMHHELARCGDCGSLFATAVPSADALEREYGDASFDSGEEAALASRTYIEALRPLRLRLSMGSALDIGTGDGAFLQRLLEFGYVEVTGIEPSEAPIAASAPAVRPCIRKEMFRPGLFPAAAFDLVTCFQTIEHVPDPEELVREAHRILRPGGALAIVCHDRESLVNRLLGRRSPIFDIEHLQLLTRRGATALLERSGFADVAVRSILNRYPVGYWARLSPLPDGVKARVEAHRDAAVLALPLSIPVGNILTVGWKR